MNYTLKGLRLMREMSRQELAGKIGVTVSTIQNYEKGMTEPSVTVSKKYADALGCELAEFVALVERARREREAS